MTLVAKALYLADCPWKRLWWADGNVMMLDEDRLSRHALSSDASTLHSDSDDGSSRVSNSLKPMAGVWLNVRVSRPKKM